MHWSDAIKEQIGNLNPILSSPSLIDQIYSVIDLTSLNADDTEVKIASLLQSAQRAEKHVAAVCVYPQFVSLAAAALSGTPVKIATVANFPAGDVPLETVLMEIKHAAQMGANEIDVVFPYERYLSGEQQYARQFVHACKEACGYELKLKIILETGALVDPVIIADASLDALTAGADFIKTSTGKMPAGATLEAATTMLLVMRHAMPKLHREVGIKISGGIRTIEQAAQYIELANNIMGPNWVTPDTFRIGASKLVDELIKNEV